MSDASILSLNKVSFSYPDGRNILQSADFSLHENEQIGLYGPNGSGKTTFFRIIMGLAQISEGEICLHGRAVQTENDFVSLRHKIGLVMQNADDQLFCPTVIEDVAFGPINMGMGRSEARDKALLALQAVGLDGFENRLTHRLSGGEKKLVSIATVLSMQPDILLLDEPTNGLDPESQKRIEQLLQRLTAPRIIISHNWDFLTHTSNSYLTIQDGKLTDRMPFAAHSHTHAHPFGNTLHHHGD